MILRTVLCGVALAAVLPAAPPLEYSADVVTLDDGAAIQTVKLYVAGPKSRMEGMQAAHLGRIATIARKDLGLSWVLYLDKRQYSESPISASAGGAPQLGSFDPSKYKTERLGREIMLGQDCAKLRVWLPKTPGGRQLTAVVWLAEKLRLPVRMETMGLVQETRNIRAGPQPAGLFEIPSGFTKAGRTGGR